MENKRQTITSSMYCRVRSTHQVTGTKSEFATSATRILCGLPIPFSVIPLKHPTSLTKISTTQFAQIHAALISRINTPLNIPMKRRIWPILYRHDMPVFHRIPINIIHMGLVIPLVSNLVFPKSPLPKRRLRSLYVGSV